MTFQAIVPTDPPTCIVCGYLLPPLSGHVFCTSVCAQAHRIANPKHPYWAGVAR